MSWIESHSELRDHPKRKKLSRLLGLGMYETVGLLNVLWWWAMDYAPDGDLSRYAPEDVADGIDYSGAPGPLLTALQEAGFLDGLVIHDWDEYGEKLFRRRKANAERMRNARAENVQNTCETHAEREDRQTDRTDRTDKMVSSQAVENLITWSVEHIRGWEGGTEDPGFFSDLLGAWSESQVRTAMKTASDQSAKKKLSDPRAYLAATLARQFPQANARGGAA